MTEEVPSVPGASEEAAAPLSSEQIDSQPEQAERQVPLSALESERERRQKKEDDYNILQENFNLLQRRMQQPPPSPSEPTPDTQDVVTFGDLNKVAGKFQNEIRATLNEMQMSRRYPDYDEVVRKYLPNVIGNNSKMKATLESSQDFDMAYTLAKSSDEYRKDHQQKKKSTDAERILSNSEQSGNLSSVGGTSPISMVKRYRDMSDEDFKKVASRNLGYV